MGRKSRYYVGRFDQEKYDNWNALCKLARPADYARVHTCEVAMDVVARNRYELTPHSAYSPDLAPSDFLFQNLKKDIRGCHWSDEEDVSVFVELVGGKESDVLVLG